MGTDQGITQLADQLRWTLQHLYDPAELPNSPVAVMLGLAGSEAGSALREILLQAIEMLQPVADCDPQSRAWRLYGALYYRYVDQFPQHEVAKSLGLSVRQLRRQEHHALCMLAERLLARPGLSRANARAVRNEGEDRLPPPAAAPSMTRAQELDYLQHTALVEAVNATEVVQSAMRTIAPLSQALKVTLALDAPSNVPRLNVPNTSARQALVNLLSAAVRAVPGDTVKVTVRSQRRQVSIDVLPQGQRSGPCSEEWAESLQMAHELAGLCGGALEINWGQGDEPPFTARLELPAVDEAAVLIVDDNADALQLFERYLAGTAYTFAGATDPRRALALAQELRPRVVVLDVMLPGIDGWELLEHLREDPDTSRIPVVICTILPEAQLALALGAAEFLRKPVSQAEFLATLGRLAGQE